MGVLTVEVVRSDVGVRGGPRVVSLTKETVTRSPQPRSPSRRVGCTLKAESRRGRVCRGGVGVSRPVPTPAGSKTLKSLVPGSLDRGAPGPEGPHRKPV